MPVPLDAPLPVHLTTWAVPTEAISERVVPHSFGEVHEMMHRDIAIGNDFRKERIKLLITVATGVFAVITAFNKDLFSGHTSGPALAALLISFVFLLGSILCGIYHFKAWEDFYLAHRGLSAGLWKYRTAAGDPALMAEGTKQHNRARNETDYHRNAYKGWDIWQTTSLMIGLVLVVFYVLLQAVQTAPKPVPKTTAHGLAAEIVK